MAKQPTPSEQRVIEVKEIATETVTFTLLGRTPLITHPFSPSNIDDLLVPHRKTTAERAATLRVDPLQEYRDCIYHMRPGEGPDIECGLPAPAIKDALAKAALRVPGATKVEISQLCWVEGYYLPVWGNPEMLFSMVRLAPPARMPAPRFRAHYPEWCTEVRVTYTVPLLNSRVITNLLHAAGLLMGVGDWRQEKGKGTFGQFEIVPSDHPAVQRLKAWNRATQNAKIASPDYADAETERVMLRFDSLLRERGKEELTRAKRGKAA